MKSNFLKKLMLNYKMEKKFKIIIINIYPY